MIELTRIKLTYTEVAVRSTDGRGQRASALSAWIGRTSQCHNRVRVVQAFI